jgi:hypothetical protein
MEFEVVPITRLCEVQKYMGTSQFNSTILAHMLGFEIDKIPLVETRF